ncbi:hypothetical protein NPIL_250181 [Nephila pilipes]|uniref:Uncharacterized protein n=1 Tax=Nephila pilipes TaxID=299642 RepID=A0A8X6NIW7_NEPPI|nr:hypothetical protein NPIL_250181 [Nephila pilipes]
MRGFRFLRYIDHLHESAMRQKAIVDNCAWVSAADVKICVDKNALQNRYWTQFVISNESCFVHHMMGTGLFSMRNQKTYLNKPLLTSNKGKR